MSTFIHRHAAHCESGVIANLMTHSGIALSEAMAFGLASGLTFAYLPFIKISGQPLIAYRVHPKAIIRRVAKHLQVQVTFQTFSSEEKGQAALDTALAHGEVVGLQTSVYWLPYFPQDMRFHFNAHHLVVYGKEGDDYLISDPVFEQTTRCNQLDMARARFTKGTLAPKGLMYKIEGEATAVSAHAIVKSIVKTCQSMQTPVPIAGVKGIKALARKIKTLDPSAASTASLVGHIVRMQEEIGTGGAGFRFLYAAFLQEAAAFAGLSFLSEYTNRLMTIGDDWRMFALKTARMVKGRDPMEPEILAQALNQLADAEHLFFKNLKADIKKVSSSVAC